MEYFLVVNNERVGPISEDKLLEAGMKADSLVWREGMDNWQAASKVEGLKNLFPAVPAGGFTPGPPPPPPAAPPMPMASPAAPQAMPVGHHANHAPPPAAWSPRPYPVPYGPPDSPRTFNLIYFWYVGILGAAVVLTIMFIVMMAVLDSMRSRNAMEVFMVFYVFIMIGLGIAYIVMQNILLYKMWSQIQDGYASTTPGMAVGLSFIPIFNFVWYFFAYYGLSKGQNLFLYRHGIGGRYSSEAMMLTTCILMVIPYVNFIALLILMPISMLFLKNTAADIAQSRMGQAPQRF